MQGISTVQAPVASAAKPGAHTHTLGEAGVGPSMSILLTPQVERSQRSPSQRTGSKHSHFSWLSGRQRPRPLQKSSRHTISHSRPLYVAGSQHVHVPWGLRYPRGPQSGRMGAPYRPSASAGEATSVSNMRFVSAPSEGELRQRESGSTVKLTIGSTAPKGSMAMAAVPGGGAPLTAAPQEPAQDELLPVAPYAGAGKAPEAAACMNATSAGSHAEA
mmetsp:Transcript_16591/g.62802  ORF Transcript_16591/g.62802 Transcript_16591/m.62802 type:complete len:217 (+) Transcript_16591:188-838(+)